ncbi:hypothetical protein ABPG74_013406 [Tetrahymena malaccensis]
MGQISSQQQQSTQINKKPLSIFHNRKHNPYGQKINQFLKTEEDEKNFYEEYSIIEREDDIFLGDCIIMRENNSKLKVCVKEMAVQSREHMRYIQQNLLNNFNCYNNEEEINESQANLANACQNDVLSYKDIVAKREDKNSQKQIQLMNNYHLNLISVVRVVKAKDELDFFLCNQNFRILYALEYSDLNLQNYFIDEKSSLNEQDIWQLLEQLTSALLFLQQQGKSHGNLTSRSIFIMPCSNCLHREQQKLKNVQICECLNQFKWYKIVESELIRSQSMYERIFQDVFYNKINLKDSKYNQIIRGFYLSPEMIEDINQNKYKFCLDQYKADVFTLGCVILEAMSKSLKKYSLNVSLDGIFEYRQVNSQSKCLYNQEKLKSLIQTISFSCVYSESLMNIIRNMVNFDYSKRPDFKELAFMLQRIGKYNTSANRQQLSKEIEAISSFNMTKSVQLNTLSSEQGNYQGDLNNNQKIVQEQNLLDCLQQIQSKQQQASFYVETANKNDDKLEQNFSKNVLADQYKKEEIITITPIQEVNYTQEMMKLDVAEEDQQFLQNNMGQKQNDNDTKIYPQTQRNQSKNKIYASNSKVLNCMINKENKEKLDENDTTLGSLINKTSRNDLSSLNTSIISGAKGSSRAILQENKQIQNNQELIKQKPISESYQTEKNDHIKQHTNFEKQFPQVQTYNKEVYDMIDSNYKKNLIDYQHKRSNSTYTQYQNVDQNNSLNFCYDSIKKYPLSNYDTNSRSSNKVVFNQHDEQNFYKRSSSIQKLNQQNETRDFDSLIIKDTDKFEYISNNSVIQQQQSVQSNFSTVIPQIKSQFKSYISSNNNEIGKNLENAIKQTNQIIQNQRQQLIQYMQNNFNEPSNITSQKDLKNERNLPINTIPLPTDQGWKLQDSLPSHRSQCQKINSNNNQNGERLQSVHIENFDQSFQGSESQLSIRSYQTNKLNGTLQTICTPQISTQTYLSNQYNSENATNSSKIDPKIYENSVKLKKLSRNMSLKDQSELRILDQQYKINKPNQNIPNTSFNNNTISSYLTPREEKSESTKQGQQELQFYQNQKLPLLKIDQIEEKQTQKISLANPIQIGQNTESILDCSLLNDNKNNSQIYSNQMQLFTYSTGTLPSSTRNGCKRRTQSSYINDTQYTNQNNYLNLNSNLNSYLDSELTLNTLNNCELKVSSNQNSNKNSLDQLKIQEAQSENLNPLKMQSQKDTSKIVSSQQKQQLNSLQLNSQRAHKFDLETVQELKESQFNQTTNISAKKLTCQSAQGFQIEGSNVLLTSFTPIKASQNLISNINLQSQKKEKLSSSKIQENNLLSQHSPPQNNKIIAKKYLDKEEEKFQKCSSVSNIQKEYVYEKYEDGAYYEGENWGTLRWGLGKFVYADGACYEGEWERGQMNGFGKLYYPSGQLAYEGKWKDDKFDGRGVIHNEKPIPISYGQEIDYQDFNKMSEEWTKFDGEFKIDEKSGFGTFYFSNSSKFQCNFVNDMAQGVGTFTLSDGKTQIVGEWKQNILVNIYQQKQINQ